MQRQGIDDKLTIYSGGQGSKTFDQPIMSIDDCQKTNLRCQFCQITSALYKDWWQSREGSFTHGLLANQSVQQKRVWRMSAQSLEERYRTSKLANAPLSIMQPIC